MRLVTVRRVGVLLAVVLFVGVRALSQGPPAGEKYALLVGVHRYDPVQPLPTLTYPEDDVDALANVLVAAGYKRENIKLMTQKAGGDDPRFFPTADKVRKEFRLTLKRLDESDSVLVALAGHGVQFQQDGPSYFCPSDADLDDVKTLLPLGELANELESCQAGFKLLLVDACRNNPKLRVARAAGRPVLDLPSLSRPFVRRGAGGTAALFSCSPGEIAFEDPGLKHGVFFYYVIEGLKGGADRDSDGRVDVEELASFTKKNVAKFVDQTFGREQTPETIKNQTRGSVAIVSLGRGRPEAAKVEVAARTSPVMPRLDTGEKKTLTNGIGMKLVLIPAGEFLMGSNDGDDDEKPAHRVRITQAFYLGTTEVTQGQYRAVTGENPSEFKGSDDLPVENVSWNEAVSFCNKLSEREGLKPYYRFGDGEQSGGDGYRLPTEGEWEYACRAGSTTRYSFGDDESSLGEYAWLSANSDSKTHPVGQKRANAWGLFDMHGNVWEWCWDGYDKDYYRGSPGSDPSGPSGASDRVNRGGSWSLSPRIVRSADRDGDTPGDRYDNLGFRVARGQSSR